MSRFGVFWFAMRTMTMMMAMVAEARRQGVTL